MLARLRVLRAEALRAARAQALAVPGQREEGRGQEFRSALVRGKALRWQIGPRHRHRGALSVGKLQDHPWLILPPKEVEKSGELTAHLAAMLAYSDHGAWDK